MNMCAVSARDFFLFFSFFLMSDGKDGRKRKGRKELDGWVGVGVF